MFRIAVNGLRQPTYAGDTCAYSTDHPLAINCTFWVSESTENLASQLLELEPGAFLHVEGRITGAGAYKSAERGMVASLNCAATRIHAGLLSAVSE